MEPVVSEVALENRNTFAVAKLNAIQNPKTANKYLVRGHPVYLIFKDGKNVGRFVRETPKEEFVQNVLDAIGN